MKPNKKQIRCNHDKVYQQGGVGTNIGYSVNWICSKCGKEGVDFTPRRDEYQEIREKFRKLK